MSIDGKEDYLLALLPFLMFIAMGMVFSSDFRFVIAQLIGEAFLVGIGILFLWGSCNLIL